MFEKIDQNKARIDAFRPRLEKAHEDDTAFVHFIAERVEETQKDLLRLLTGET